MMPTEYHKLLEITYGYGTRVGAVATATEFDMSNTYTRKNTVSANPRGATALCAAVAAELPMASGARRLC